MVVLFDLGGVIEKPIPIDELYSFLNPDISFDEFTSFWNKDKTVIYAHKGLISDKKHIEILLKHCKSSKTYKQFYDKYITMEKGTYDATIDIIDKLKKNNIKTGILSNLRKMDFTRHSKNKSINFKKFNYLFLSYKMKTVKPENKIYDKVIKKCRCKPEEIFFFDDRIENIVAAKRTGIKAYQVTGENINEIMLGIEDLSNYLN